MSYFKGNLILCNCKFDAYIYFCARSLARRGRGSGVGVGTEYRLEVLRFRPWIRLGVTFQLFLGLMVIPIPYPDQGKSGFITSIEVL